MFVTVSHLQISYLCSRYFSLFYSSTAVGKKLKIAGFMSEQQIVCNTKKKLHFTLPVSDSMDNLFLLGKSFYSMLPVE